MKAFANTAELHSTMELLWRTIKADQAVKSKLAASRLVVRFIYKDPDGIITIDGTDGKDLKVYVGACDMKPDVEFAMNSEIAHQFWLGKLNVPMSLVNGRIASKGSVQKALALLPAVKPAFEMYPDVFSTVKAEAA